jgi:hypothetical protein
MMRKFTARMTLRARGPYHCTIYPEMVGALAAGQ